MDNDYSKDLLNISEIIQNTETQSNDEVVDDDTQPFYRYHTRKHFVRVYIIIDVLERGISPKDGALVYLL